MGFRDSARALGGVVRPLLAVAASGLTAPQSAFTGAVAVVIFAALLALIVLKEPGRDVGEVTAREWDVSDVRALAAQPSLRGIVQSATTARKLKTVRDTWGTTGFQLRLGFPDQLKLRKQINQGRLFGPTLYTAGPIMEGPPPAMPLMPVFDTPEAAEKSVSWQAAQGYDFIKVYDQLSVETYRAILKAAQEHSLPVIGHTPKQVGLEAVLAGG